jgi:hypothetical protein
MWSGGYTTRDRKSWPGDIPIWWGGRFWPPPRSWYPLLVYFLSRVYTFHISTISVFGSLIICLISREHCNQSPIGKKLTPPEKGVPGPPLWGGKPEVAQGCKKHPKFQSFSIEKSQSPRSLPCQGRDLLKKGSQKLNRIYVKSQFRGVQNTILGSWNHSKVVQILCPAKEHVKVTDFGLVF